MSTLPALLLMGAFFIAIVFAFRYYNHKTMTERVCARNPDSEYCRMYYKKKMDRSEDQFKHCDVVYGETPKGGVKTLICYVSDDNRMVKKKEASKILIREVDENNKPVYETWTTMEESEPTGEQ